MTKTKANPTDTPSTGLMNQLKTMSAAATMMMGKRERDMVVTEVQSLCDRLESLLSDRAKLEEALGKYDSLFSQTRGFQELYDAHEEIGAALNRSADRG